MSSGQDWTEVVITKSKTQKTAGMNQSQVLTQARMSGAQVTTQKKFSAGENKSAHSTVTGSLKKLEESTEEFKHPTVDLSVSRAIASARLAKHLTQKDLATAINERPQVIQELESGKAMPNPAILQKLDRALGVHLPRGVKR